MSPPTNKKCLEKEDFLSYLEKVKFKFMNQPYVFEAFVDIIEDFKKKRIATPTLILHVKHLFRDHPDLMVGFNVCLPPGYKIEGESNKAVSLFS